MTRSPLRALLACFLLSAPTFAARSAKKTPPASRDGYNALNMEAQAVMGEMKYENGDMSDARRTYQNSLKAGKKISQRESVSALDHYRIAEIAMNQGDYPEARKHLELLLRHYPMSEWAERGQSLLDAMSGADTPDLPHSLADAPFVPALPAATAEESLERLRSAVSQKRDDEALGEAYDFVRRYPSDPVVPEALLAAAALHLRRGEPDRAIPLLLPLVRGKSTIVQDRAIHLMGAALFSLGRNAEVLKSVPAADPASTTNRWLALAQIWRAAAMKRLGQKEESAKLYRAFTAGKVDSPMRAYALAAVASDDWERLGRPEQAHQTLALAGQAAARWGLDDLRDTLALAEANALARAERLEEAAKGYADFAKRFPKSPLVTQALYERGLALKRLDRKKDAARALESLLERSPDSAYAADAHLQLGQIYAELGHPSEALAHYRSMAKASEAKDADREALILMAQVHYNAKRWNEAIPLYRRYLKGAPEDAKTREVRGLLLVSLWQSNPESPELLELAAKIPEHPLVAQMRWDLAAKAYQRGNWAKAAELFQRQLDSDPRSPRAPDALFFRAEALRQLKKTDDAIAAYRRFLSARPSHSRAREAAMRLGALLYESGDAAGAATVYGRVTGGDAEAADAAYNRAIALSKAGINAAPAWESFAVRFPKHAKASWAYWNAGRLREEHGELPGALKDYEKATGADERAKSLYAIGRLRERLKQGKAAQKAYEKLQTALPKDDPARLAGLLRLGLMLELQDKTSAAASLYAEVVRYAKWSSEPYKTARKRLDALKNEK